MQPDYPHKIFDDKRLPHFLLVEALAREAAQSPVSIFLL